MNVDKVHLDPSRERRTPHERLPDRWEPTSRHEALADELGLDVAHEAFKFREHAKKHDRRIPSWNNAFNRWLTMAVIYERKAQVARKRSR